MESGSFSSPSSSGFPSVDLRATTEKLQELLSHFKAQRSSGVRSVRRDVSMQTVEDRVGSKEALPSGWREVNRNLRQRGLSPVNLHQTRDALTLDGMTNELLLSTLSSLMTDCDYKQKQIEQWMEAAHLDRVNLKEEQERNQRLTMHHEHLEKQLRVEMNKVEEMERTRMEELKYHGEEVQNLRHAKLDLEGRYKQLELKCKRQERTISQLQQRYQKLLDKEEQRVQKHRDILANSRPKGLPESKALELVDAYQTKLNGLEEELEFLRREIVSQNESYLGQRDDGRPSSSFRPLYQRLKDTEKHAMDLKSQLDCTEATNRELREEIERRPKKGALKELEMHIRRLEVELNEDGSSVSGDVQAASLALCRKSLKAVCKHLKVSDLNGLMPSLKRLTLSIGKMEEFIANIVDVAERGPKGQDVSAESVEHAVWCEAAWHHVIPTMEYWLTLLHKREDKGRGRENRQIAEHFKKLFDVQSTAGTLTKMNEVYTRSGELSNFMKALADTLSVDQSASCWAIVKRVETLVKTAVGNTDQEDLCECSRTRQIAYYDQFFPTFQSLVTRLVQILGVTKIDEIIPEVKKLASVTL